MKSTNIKLKDLLKLRLTEAEEEKAAEEPKEDKAEDSEEEENPFASADDAGDKEDSAEGEAEDDKKEAKPEEPKGIVVRFKRPSVKRYNDQEFLDTEGELVGLNKDGAKVKISDGSIIFVNFNDII